MAVGRFGTVIFVCCVHGSCKMTWPPQPPRFLQNSCLPSQCAVPVALWPLTMEHYNGSHPLMVSSQAQFYHLPTPRILGWPIGEHDSDPRDLSREANGKSPTSGGGTEVRRALSCTSHPCESSGSSGQRSSRQRSYETVNRLADAMEWDDESRRRKRIDVPTMT